MKRMTEKRENQNVIPLRKNGETKWAICSAGMGDAPTEYLYGDHADRLAAYEDPGLEPCETNEKYATIMAFNKLRLKVSLTRLCELLQAETEGRCVVLPCAIGGRLYRPSGNSYEVYEIEVDRQFLSEGKVSVFAHPVLPGNKLASSYESFSSNSIGKTVFLTSEEAYTALKEARR